MIRLVKETGLSYLLALRSSHNVHNLQADCRPWPLPKFVRTSIYASPMYKSAHRQLPPSSVSATHKRRTPLRRLHRRNGKLRAQVCKPRAWSGGLLRQTHHELAVTIWSRVLQLSTLDHLLYIHPTQTLTSDYHPLIKLCLLALWLPSPLYHPVRNQRDQRSS